MNGQTPASCISDVEEECTLARTRSVPTSVQVLAMCYPVKSVRPPLQTRTLRFPGPCTCCSLPPLSHLPLPLLPLPPLSPDRSPHEPDTLLPQDLCTGYSLFPSRTRCASSPPSGLRVVATFSVGPAYLERHPAPPALPCSTPVLIFLPDAHLQVIDSLVIRSCLGSNKGRDFCLSHSQLYFPCLRPSLAMAGVPQITV